MMHYIQYHNYIKRRINSNGQRLNNNYLIKYDKSLIAAIKKGDKFLYQKFYVHTDAKNIEWLRKKTDMNKTTNPMHYRWVIALRSKDFEVQHVKGIENIAADHLSRYINYAKIAQQNAILWMKHRKFGGGISHTKTEKFTKLHPEVITINDRHYKLEETTKIDDSTKKEIMTNDLDHVDNHVENKYQLHCERAGIDNKYEMDLYNKYLFYIKKKCCMNPKGERVTLQ